MTDAKKDAFCTAVDAINAITASVGVTCANSLPVYERQQLEAKIVELQKTMSPANIAKQGVNTALRTELEEAKKRAEDAAAKLRGLETEKRKLETNIAKIIDEKSTVGSEKSSAIFAKEVAIEQAKKSLAERNAAVAAMLESQKIATIEKADNERKRNAAFAARNSAGVAIMQARAERNAAVTARSQSNTAAAAADVERNRALEEVRQAAAAAAAAKVAQTTAEERARSLETQLREAQTQRNTAQQSAANAQSRLSRNTAVVPAPAPLHPPAPGGRIGQQRITTAQPNRSKSNYTYSAYEIGNIVGNNVKGIGYTNIKSTPKEYIDNILSNNLTSKQVEDLLTTLTTARKKSGLLYPEYLDKAIAYLQTKIQRGGQRKSRKSRLRKATTRKR